MTSRVLTSIIAMSGVPLSIFLSAAAGAQTLTDGVLEQIVVTVNGDIITKREIDERIRVTRALADEGADVPEPAMLTRVLRDAVDERLMMQRAAELGIDVGEADVNRVLERVKTESHVDSEEAFHSLLEREGMSLSTLRANTRRRLLIEQVRQHLFSRISVSNDEALRYFNANQGELVHGERVTYRELRIPVPPHGRAPDAERDRALVRVVGVRDQLASGAAFETVASAISDGASPGHTGVVGPVAIDAVEPALRAALKGLEPGAVSIPVETPDGYAFVKLERYEAATTPAFHDSRDQVIDTLLARKQEAALQDLLTRLRSAALLQWKRRDLEAAYERPSDYR